MMEEEYQDRIKILRTALQIVAEGLPEGERQRVSAIIAADLKRERDEIDSRPPRSME